MAVNFQSPNTFGAEGVDHCNISHTSATHLGRVLDPSYRRAFSYPHIGKFSSVLNLWYWIKHSPQNDKLRTCTHNEIRRITSAENLTSIHVVNFKAIIGLATYWKLMCFPNLVEEIRSSEPVRLLSYYHPKRCVIRVSKPHASVMVPICDYVLTCVRENREPDFTEFDPKIRGKSSFYLDNFLKFNFGAEVPSEETVN